MHSQSLSEPNLFVFKRQPIKSSSRLIITDDVQKTLYSCIKKIDDQLFKVKFYSKNSKLYLNISDAHKTHTLLIPPTLSSEGHNKILSHLNIRSEIPYFSLKPWELLEKKVKKFGDTCVPVEFWYNKSLKSIKVQSFNLSKEFSVSDNIVKIQQMIEFLFESIKIRNNEIVFEEFKEICIAQTVKFVNNEPVLIRILREKSKGRVEFHSSYRTGWDLRIQFYDFSGNKTESVFSLDEICDKFQTTPEKIDEKVPEMLSRVELKQKNIFFSRIPSKVLKMIKVFACNKKILNTYHISFYQILEIPNYLFITAELTLNFQYFLCIGVKFEEGLSAQKVFYKYLQELTIRKGKLCIVPKDLDCFNYSAQQIQKVFRGYLSRAHLRLLKTYKSKPKIIFISGKLFGSSGIKVLIKESKSSINIICTGDYSANLEFPQNSLINSNYRLIIQSLYIKDGKIEINSNLLTVFTKNQKFSLPLHLHKYKKILEKWKMVQNEYSRVSIYELHDNIAVLIDMNYKIYTKKEILDIYHELSYECIFEEVILKGSEIYLDPSLRPEPFLILSRKLYSDSFVSVILRDHIGKDLLKQQALVFDVSFNAVHHRVIINLEKAEEKSGIPKAFLVAISNYLIKHSLKASQDSISLNLSIPKCDINSKVNSLQKLFRGYLVRKNIGKILVSNQNFLVAVKKQRISDMDFMLFAYVQGGKIRIEAMDKEYRLVLYLDHNLVQGFGEERKKVIEEVIFSNLFIDSSCKMKRLCIDTFILQKPQRKARRLSMKYERKSLPKVSFKDFERKGRE